MTITEILDELSIPWAAAGTHRHVTQGRAGVDCPRCSPGEAKYKLGIHLASGGASCWTCGKFRLAEVLVECGGIGWARANELAKAFDGGFTPAREEVRGKLIVPKGVGPLLKPHRAYLRSRRGGGFDPDQLAKDWGVQGIGFAAELAWRLFLPIHLGGKVVSWSTRGLSDEGGRYVNAKPEQESVRAKTLLFGADKAKHSVVVVEGYFGVYKLGPGAVATMGLSVTKEQVAKIAKFPNRTIIMDSEPEAQKVAERLAQELSCFPGRTRRVEIEAADPGECGEREVALIRKAFLR